MKTNELQIGDLVINRNNNEIIHIFVIDDYGDVVKNEPDYYCSERNICIDDIEPIPLTAEILEKNGTLLEVGDNGIGTPSNQRNRYEKWLISSTWNSVNIWFDRHTKLYHVADMSRARFKHVHELQHALRLCGLNDLADNFIVQGGIVQ